MRKISLFIILAIFILVLQPQALVAQDDPCTIELSAVYAALGNAQGSSAAGDQDAALASIAEARQLLQQIEANCGVSDIANVPTDAVDAPSGPREGAILLVVAKGTRNPLELGRLEGLAFINGFELIIETDSRNTERYFDGSEDIAAVIYAGYVDNQHENDMAALAEFVDNGGYVVMMYNERWEEGNDLLQDLFRVSVVAENVQNSDGQFVFPSEMLLPYNQGLQIGIIDEGLSRLGISAYLLTPQSGSSEGYASNDQGEARLVSFANESGNLIFFPGIQYNYNPYHIFEDEFIEQFDNEAAMIALFNYLLGQ